MAGIFFFGQIWIKKYTYIWNQHVGKTKIIYKFTAFN